MSIKTEIPLETLDLLGRFEAHALRSAASRLFPAWAPPLADAEMLETEAAELARRFVVALQAIGVDQWAELGLVLTSLFVTQLKIEQARRDTLVEPTPN
jgi:hypothetical protein